MGKCVYVDNSNVWIEGKYHSAVAKGMVADVYEAHSPPYRSHSCADRQAEH